MISNHELRKRAAAAECRQPFRVQDLWRGNWCGYDAERGVIHANLCGICGQPIRYRTQASLDHITPLSLGGTETRENVRLAHKRCNAARGNETGGDAA